MQEINWDKEREKLDREITLFHFKQAKRMIERLLFAAYRKKNKFFIYYFHAQEAILDERFSEAIILLNNALKINPKDGYTYNDRAICLAELGEYKEALQCFNKGIKIAPNCVFLYQNKGWLLNMMGRYKEAVVCFQKALELSPRREETIYSLGDTYEHLGDYQRAYEYFKRAKKLIKGKSKFVYQQVRQRIRNLKTLLEKHD